MTLTLKNTIKLKIVSFLSFMLPDPRKIGKKHIEKYKKKQIIEGQIFSYPFQMPFMNFAISDSVTFIAYTTRYLIYLRPSDIVISKSGS